MCYASGILLYGCWVTSSSLSFAAEAQAQVKPQLQALRIIMLRQRAGTLHVKDQDSHKTVRDFSREIWQRVSAALIASAIEEAEQTLINSYRCDGCQIELGVDDEGPRWAEWADLNAKREGEVWKSGWAEPSCQYCVDAICEKDPFEKPNFTLVQDLLASYGLCMPYDEVWKKDPESYHDFDSLSAIALPLSSKLAMPPSTNPNARRANTYPVVSAEAQHDYGSRSQVINISPKIFSIPSASTEQQFDALIKKWHLSVRSRTDTTILPDAPANREDEVETTTKGKKKKKVVQKLKPMSEKAKLRPHWMVWSLCEPCD